MSAIEFLSWDGGTEPNGDAALPRRPSTDDLGGDEKEDDAEWPPDDKEHPTSAGWNQIVQQIAAMSRTVPACKLEIRFNAGVPYVARVTAPSGNVAVATFTVTDTGTGVVTVEWPANAFPAAQCSPTGLTVLSSSTQVSSAHVEEITNGIRVRTFINGVAADVPWTLTLN